MIGALTRASSIDVFEHCSISTGCQMFYLSFAVKFRLAI